MKNIAIAVTLLSSLLNYANANLAEGDILKIKSQLDVKVPEGRNKSLLYTTEKSLFDKHGLFQNINSADSDFYCELRLASHFEFNRQFSKINTGEEYYIKNLSWAWAGKHRSGVYLELSPMNIESSTSKFHFVESSHSKIDVIYCSHDGNVREPIDDERLFSGISGLFEIKKNGTEE